jgi:hypothetical protein
MDKCKFCGAEITPTGRYIDIKNTHYACGTICWATTGELSRDTDCFRRQLAQSEARARELFEALSRLINREDFSRYDANETVAKHAGHFRN